MMDDGTRQARKFGNGLERKLQKGNDLPQLITGTFCDGLHVLKLGFV